MAQNFDKFSFTWVFLHFLTEKRECLIKKSHCQFIVEGQEQKEREEEVGYRKQGTRTTGWSSSRKENSNWVMNQEHQWIECHVVTKDLFQSRYSVTQKYCSLFWKANIFISNCVFFLVSQDLIEILITSWIHCDQWVHLNLLQGKY